MSGKETITQIGEDLFFATLNTLGSPKTTYGGSIVVKKTHLLNMIDNMRLMFLSKVSNDSKMHVWGQQCAYENILKEDISTRDMNKFITEYIWDNPWTAGVKPYELFAWIEEAEAK